jgi:hypothetical protein
LDSVESARTFERAPALLLRTLPRFLGSASCPWLWIYFIFFGIIIPSPAPNAFCVSSRDHFLNISFSSDQQGNPPGESAGLIPLFGKPDTRHRSFLFFYFLDRNTV